MDYDCLTAESCTSLLEAYQWKLMLLKSRSVCYSMNGLSV